MNFYKLITKIVFLSVILAKASFASGHKLGELPTEIFQHITKYLSEEEKSELRQTSKSIRQIADEPYKLNLEKQFINSASLVLGDVLTYMPEITLAPSKSHYTNTILQETCENYLEKDGFLAVSYGSALEGYLIQNYKSVLFYNYLKDQPDYTKELFKIFFGKTIPEEKLTVLQTFLLEGNHNKNYKYDHLKDPPDHTKRLCEILSFETNLEEKYALALNLLCGCLPSKHIYVNKDIQDTSPFLEKFCKTLLQSIKNNTRKYFLLGIDEDFSVLKEREHVIVINQSNQEDLHKLENLPHKTVIFNADQEVLNLSYDFPKKMKNLILVNGNNQCTSIGNCFLMKNATLHSCITKGLYNVQEIGRLFLSDCPNLSTFDPTGFKNVQRIGTYFLYRTKLDGDKIKEEILSRNGAQNKE